MNQNNTKTTWATNIISEHNKNRLILTTLSNLNKEGLDSIFDGVKELYEQDKFVFKGLSLVLNAVISQKRRFFGLTLETFRTLVSESDLERTSAINKEFNAVLSLAYERKIFKRVKEANAKYRKTGIFEITHANILKYLEAVSDKKMLEAQRKELEGFVSVPNHETNPSPCNSPSISPELKDKTIRKELEDLDCGLCDFTIYEPHGRPSCSVKVLSQPKSW